MARYGGEYTPQRGEHAGETFSSYYAYRNVYAHDQGYSSYGAKRSGEIPINDNTAYAIGRAEERYGEHYSNLVRGDTEFARLYQEAKAEHFDKRAHGALAKWLEYSGARDEGAEYDVGDTPNADN